MKRVIIHVGFPKTGTTTIQNFCNRHRDSLRANGVDYPALWVAGSSEKPRASHPALVNGLLLQPPPRLALEQARSIALVDQTFADFADNEATTLFLSHETLSQRKDLDFARLRAWLSDYPVTLVAFLRTFDEWLESMFQQRLLHFNAPARPFMETHLSRSAAMNYLGQLRGLREGLPDAAFQVLSFDRYRRGGLIERMLEVIGADTPALKEAAARSARANVSRAVAEVMFGAYLSAATDDSTVAKQVDQGFAQVRAAGQAIPYADERFRFVPAAFKQQARERYRDDLPALHREFAADVDDPGPVDPADPSYRTHLEPGEYDALLAAVRPFIRPDLAERAAHAYPAAHRRLAPRP